jgi:hypothetical protein
MSFMRFTGGANRHRAGTVANQETAIGEEGLAAAENIEVFVRCQTHWRARSRCRSRRVVEQRRSTDVRGTMVALAATPCTQRGP